MRQIFWVLALLGSMIGGVEFFFALTIAQSAPQEAAAAAVAIGWAVLPYIFARAIESVSGHLATQPTAAVTVISFKRTA